MEKKRTNLWWILIGGPITPLFFSRERKKKEKEKVGQFPECSVEATCGTSRAPAETYNKWLRFPRNRWCAVCWGTTSRIYLFNPPHRAHTRRLIAFYLYPYGAAHILAQKSGSVKKLPRVWICRGETAQLNRTAALPRASNGSGIALLLHPQQAMHQMSRNRILQLRSRKWPGRGGAWTAHGHRPALKYLECYSAACSYLLVISVLLTCDPYFF